MWITDSEAIGRTPDFLADYQPLLQELVFTGDLEEGQFVTVSASARAGDLGSLRAFLERFCGQLLFPVELPAIYQAYQYAAKNQVRELIALDRSLSPDGIGEEFTRASQRIGRHQLKRLRPLRDERVIQRYLKAVEADEAHGWHTLSYGLVLRVYSLPLREGLVHYARRTLSGLIENAAGPLRLTREQEKGLLMDLLLPLPSVLNHLLAELPHPESKSG